MTDRLLALDFDGVISDSAAEAFLVALRTFSRLWPDSEVAKQARSLRELPTRDELRSSALYPAFVTHMPLGNRAEDFGVVLDAFEAERALPDQSAYDAFRDTHEEAWLQDFHRRFYHEREILSSRHPEEWLALMAPYTPVLEVLRRRAGEVTLAVATARDRRSVKLLLDAYGIADLVEDALLLDKEAGRKKCAHLRVLEARSGIAARDSRFLDDKLNHLESVAELGVSCGLAAWGYNGEREQRQARQRGFRVCSPADVEAWGID